MVAAAMPMPMPCHATKTARVLTVLYFYRTAHSFIQLIQIIHSFIPALSQRARSAGSMLRLRASEASSLIWQSGEGMQSSDRVGVVPESCCSCCPYSYSVCAFIIDRVVLPGLITTNYCDIFGLMLAGRVVMHMMTIVSSSCPAGLYR